MVRATKSRSGTLVSNGAKVQLKILEETCLKIKESTIGSVTTINEIYGFVLWLHLIGKQFFDLWSLAVFIQLTSQQTVSILQVTKPLFMTTDGEIRTIVWASILLQNKTLISCCFKQEKLSYLNLSIHFYEFRTEENNCKI